MRKLFFTFLFISTIAIQAQELDCKVDVNFAKITNANVQIFKNLEKSLTEFVSKTQWTSKKVAPTEKISCTMFITIEEYESNTFKASLQVQASRPVFNSTYTSSFLSINDKDFSFRFVEFENLIFNPNSFDSNLISVIAFYSTMIVALDSETYAYNGGDEYFKNAQDIVNVAAQGGFKGWSQQDGNQNRFFLINDMLSPTFVPFRQAITEYYLDGLDKMADDLKAGKVGVAQAIETISKLNSVRPNSYLSRVFFDSKADEIVSIFSGGPTVPIANLTDNLTKVSPLNTYKWLKIKI
ncbi:MAG: hypothetical protein ACI9XR_001678 [Flavobacterium sp.]|jgi:hypothetical protein